MELSPITGMDKYKDFMNQIPDEIMQKVEKYLCSNVALFKPSIYVTGVTMHSDDFHIIIPSGTPPDTYISDKLKSLDAGKIITINPGETIFCKKAHPTKQYFSLLIKPELMVRVAQEMDISDNVRFLKLQNPFSKELMQAIKNFDAEVQRSGRFTLMLDCLAIQIVVLLLREFEINTRRKKVFLPDSDAYVSLAIEYMYAFFSSKITIKDICSEVNVSPYHFIRTFKQKTGASPHQYLMNIRIKKAEELLCTRQYSVAEVATLCGFISLPHFSNTFKAITGHSPSEYRKLYLITSPIIKN